MEQLKNQVVMVRPALADDPLQMAGHCAVISHLTSDDTAAYVHFANQMLGLYETRDLLMLVPGFVLVDKLRCMTDELEPHEVIDLMEIAFLDASDDLQHRRTALELATAQPVLFMAAVISVDDWNEGFIKDPGDVTLRPVRGR